MNYAKSDKWFWIPIDRDDYIKTFEHTRIRCADIALVHKAGSNEQEERELGLNDDNTYYFEIDTKYDKKIIGYYLDLSNLKAMQVVIYTTLCRARLILSLNIVTYFYE